MAEEPETTEQETNGTAPEPEQQESDTDYAAEAEKWKSLARKHEERAKANAEAAQKLAEYEDAQKSEQEKLTERAEAAEKAARQHETELLRLRVAMANELPAELAERLRGDTEDELQEDAKRLLELVGSQRKPADLDQGVRAGQVAQDGNAWFRQQFGPR